MAAACFLLSSGQIPLRICSQRQFLKNCSLNRLVLSGDLESAQFFIQLVGILKHSNFESTINNLGRSMVRISCVAKDGANGKVLATATATYIPVPKNK